MAFPTEKKELVFGICLVCSGLFLANSFLFGALNLGFAIGLCLCIVCSVLYLLSRGCKLRFYPAALFGFCIVTAASFARTDDNIVKLLLTLCVALCANLGICLLAGKNRRDPGTAASLPDSFAMGCRMCFGELAPAFGGITNAFRRSGTVGKKGGAVLLGLGIALPLVLILVPLLMRADAAFEGLIDMLPSVSVAEIFITLLLGGGLSIFLYTRTVAMKHQALPPVYARLPRGLSALTVNTVLVAVCVVYVAYLASQAAYFAGGFSGILPEEFTLAEYARRGFFEMAWLCALNLSIMVGALWVCIQKDPAPRFTRIACLFLGIVTLFLVVTASAKMVMYIESYGLTRLRVLTQVIMIFLGTVTLLLCLWLFFRKLPYMKFTVLTALLLAALVSWADVDTVVARYNTEAYLSGRMKTVDVAYLDSLGDGAVPYLVQLHKEAKDESIREMAHDVLLFRDTKTIRDFRSWNYASAVAGEQIAPYREAVAEESEIDIFSRPLGVD